MMPSKPYRCYVLITLILLSWQLWKSLWLPFDSDSPVKEEPLPSSLFSVGNDRDNTQEPEHEKNTSHKAGDYPLPGFCSFLPTGISAATLWEQQGERIIQATALSASHIPWMRRLFHTLTPEALDKGTVVWPWLDRFRSSILPLLHSNNETLRVAVMGGSVAEGRGCELLPRAELNSYINNTEPKVDSRKCTWVNRLQMLANAFSLPIEVFNLATGGTNSLLALPVLEFQLYHSEILKNLGGPHVLLNGYAPNDALYSWSFDTSINNATADYDHYHKAWEAASKFVSAAASSCKQKSLVVFVNDYLGNQHDRLLAEDIRSDAVRKVALDTGSMYISPTTTVRPWVYGNTRETLFTAPWWVKTRKGVERRRDVHFGMPGHIAVAWVVAYSFLRVAIEFCEQERIKESIVVAPPQVSDFTAALPLQLPWNTTFLEEWQERSSQRKQSFQPQECSAHGPCLFAFVANPAGTHRNRFKLKKYLSPHEVYNTGWQAEDDIRNGWQVSICLCENWKMHHMVTHHYLVCTKKKNKLGLTAHVTGAQLVLEFPNISQPVRTIALQSLKSYGPAWDDAVAHFNVSVRYDDPEKLPYDTSFEITGFHNETTSITYPFQLDLRDHLATAGSTLRIAMTLQTGTNFKINSLLLCDR